MKSERNIIERLLDESKCQGLERKKSGVLKALFLVKRDEINEAIIRFNKKRVWELLHNDGEFPGSYSSFLALVKKYIDQDQPQLQAPEVTPPERNAGRKPLPPQPVRHFRHDPSSDNNNEDW